MKHRPQAAHWVANFFNEKSRQCGPTDVLAHHVERAEAIARLSGAPRGARILELGSGAGGAAVACAILGYEVCAVELSQVRHGYATQLAADREVDVEFFCEDFFRFRVAGRFRVVTCWNGFGAGTDADQVALLERITDEWLEPGGYVILDIFAPDFWRNMAETEELDDETGTMHRYGFNVDTGHMTDTWWFDPNSTDGKTQRVRCYSPGEVVELGAKAGLSVSRWEVDGRDMTPSLTVERDVSSYRVVLTR